MERIGSLGGARCRRRAVGARRRGARGGDGGRGEPDARIPGAYGAFVASGRFTVTAADDVTTHDDIITFTIQLTAPDGEVAWAARVFLLLGADGLIRQDYHLTVKPLPA